jgi:hypothetical protein
LTPKVLFSLAQVAHKHLLCPAQLSAGKCTSRGCPSTPRDFRFIRKNRRSGPSRRWTDAPLMLYNHGCAARPSTQPPTTLSDVSDTSRLSHPKVASVQQLPFHSRRLWSLAAGSSVQRNFHCGYGAVRLTNRTGFQGILDNVDRNRVEQGYNSLTKAWLSLPVTPSNGNGGTCYGDSGGPTLSIWTALKRTSSRPSRSPWMRRARRPTRRTVWTQRRHARSWPTLYHSHNPQHTWVPGPALGTRTPFNPRKLRR